MQSDDRYRRHALPFVHFAICNSLLFGTWHLAFFATGILRPLATSLISTYSAAD
jgi:hypothetical protein